MSGRSALVRTVAGLGSMVLGTTFLMGALPGSAGADEPVQSTTSTSLAEGNLKCEELGYGPGLKVDPVSDGEYTKDALTVTIETEDTADGPVFSWTSNIGVDVVIVKGGPDSLVYTYDPESMGDVDLHAPVNPANDKYYGLSHIEFCYDEETTTSSEEDTTSSSEHDTTSSSEQDTTTSSEKDKDTTTTVEDKDTTTTAGEATTTTVAGATTTTVAAGELPRTGSTTFPLVAAGAILLAGGLGLLLTTRLRRS